jgi:uncharacterized protein YndB with AHSA1/START domain
MATTMNEIRKQVLLRAPQERVWRAITDAKQFGTWFGVDVDGQFAAHTAVDARITATKVDPDVAKMQEPYAGVQFQFHVDRVEPMGHFSFRWHPGGLDENVDISQQPMTLVTFELEPHADGTMLTITETGFDEIPLERRAKAFEGNSAGWEHQLRLIEKYLSLEAR